MQLKMRNAAILIFVFISSLGCKSQSPFAEGKHETIYAILNVLGKQREGNINLYKRSFTSDTYNAKFLTTIGQKVQITHVGRKNKEMAYGMIVSLKSLGKYTAAEIDSIGRKMAKPYLRPKIADFLSKKDLENMANSFVEKPIKWEKNRLTDIEMTNDKRDMSVSVPVFNVDHSIAALFVKYPNSVSLEFYERSGDDNWVFFGSGLIWRAD